ncbi:MULTISPECIES: zinc-dependent metalloprotease [Henriciella]|uniref:Peptidase n=1 Tax=Henriciella pelagia TaxID=1977912 RepID=A0ABQ1J2S4_9PROT|nr:zinc-dependent metalloprotease [Henriciella pelagia]GGB58215.1 peptidase [Henriciella pelagia]
MTWADVVDPLEHRPGFIDLYLDPDANAVYAALPAPDKTGRTVRFIYTTGLTGGLGSNPIGLDRGNASAGVILGFRKIGEQIVAEQENWRFRASADDPRERLAVAQSFASSFLWSGAIKAEHDDGRLLVDISDFLTRDQFGIAAQLKHGPDAGDYSLDDKRSFADVASALAFPDNIELDSFLTFSTSKPNAQTYATAPDARSVTLIQHHSFVRLPDDGYRPRKFDQRTANIGFGFYDYSSELSQPVVQRLSRRFRLERTDPVAATSPARKPIVFYVDPGAPKQVREALIDGASWWAEGFEAAGFEDAYRVEVLPADAHPLDVRYNIINWVHRETRGWSYGGQISDPRTGEILKANVILGSQRVRQDRMIFEGLAGVSETGTGSANDPVEISLARIRQLAAHEVGHTLGFAHNFAASSNDRASVMDYPAPYVRPVSGGLDFSQAYAVGLGDWDIFTVKWLYTEFPDAATEDAALDAMVAEAYGSGLRFTSDEHARSVDTAHPYASVWDNGADAIKTLHETMQVRQIALRDFGLDRLAAGRPTSDLNAVIVPIYLYHRYQVAAAAKYIGGLDFGYGVTGANPSPATPVPVADQQRALDALLATLDPVVLDLPDRVLNLLTPGDVGYAGGGQTLEVFPSRTGPVFDLPSAATIAADLTLDALLAPARLERVAAYEQRGISLGLSDMLTQIENSVFERPDAARHQALARIVQSRYVEALIGLAVEPGLSSEVASAVDGELRRIEDRLSGRRVARSDREKQHFARLSSRIRQHLEGETPTPPKAPDTPPGGPIGSYSSDELCWHCSP